MLLQKVTNTPGEGDGHFFVFCDLNQCCLTLRNTSFRFAENHIFLRVSGYNDPVAVSNEEYRNREEKQIAAVSFINVMHSAFFAK